MAAKLSIRRSLSLLVVTSSLSAICDNAIFDTLCFPFGIVYGFRTVPVVSGVVGVLEGELAFYGYEKCFDTEAGGGWRYS
jgi:hypothetical protein